MSKSHNSDHLKASRKGDRFAFGPRWDENLKQNRTMVGIVCRSCGTEEWRTAKTPSEPLARNMFEGSGWLVGSKRNRDLCPECRLPSANSKTEPQPVNLQDLAESSSPTEHTAPIPQQEETMESAPSKSEKSYAPIELPLVRRPAASTRKFKGRIEQDSGAGYTQSYHARLSARKYIQEMFGIPIDHPEIDDLYKMSRDSDGTYSFSVDRDLIAEPDIAGTQSPKSETQSVTNTESAHSPEPELKPVPVRKPTVQDNRRIQDQLEAWYDVNRQLYAKNFTDEAVAQHLKVPRKWVSDIRENFFGPEVNEASTKHLAEIEEAITLAKSATKQLSEMLASTSKILDQLENMKRRLVR